MARSEEERCEIDGALSRAELAVFIGRRHLRNNWRFLAPSTEIDAISTPWGSKAKPSPDDAY